jgi:hypothetical protein
MTLLAIGFKTPLTPLSPVFRIIRKPAAGLQTDVAAKRTDVTYMDRSDSIDSLFERGVTLDNQRIVSEVCKPAGGADAQTAIFEFLNHLQFRQFANTDNLLRLEESQPHIKNYVRAPGNDPRLVAIGDACQFLETVGQAGCLKIIMGWE